jgi:hypothetical protein
MMDEKELRARIADAHRDDAPPLPSALMARSRPRRPVPLVLIPLAAAAVMLGVWLRPAPPPLLATGRIELRDPLAFLLAPPAAEVLSSVPQFEGGELP